MPVERSLPFLLDFVIRTTLAAIMGAFIYAFAASRGHRLEAAQVAGLAMVIATPIAIPTACAANLALFVTSKYVGLKLIGWAAVFLVGILCTIAFPIYMGALAPATDWQRAALLPLASFLASVALWVTRHPNAAQFPVA